MVSPPLTNPRTALIEGQKPACDLTGFVLDAIVHFIAAVTEGKPVLATGREGLDNVRIIAAMNEAANLGRAVSLDL